jgi:hypothetical protein
MRIWPLVFALGALACGVEGTGGVGDEETEVPRDAGPGRPDAARGKDASPRPPDASPTLPVSDAASPDAGASADVAGDSAGPAVADGGHPSRPEGWSEESHGQRARPNYELVFPQGKVNRLDITVAAADWKRMRDDLAMRVGTPTSSLELVRGTPIYVPSTVTFQGRKWTRVGLRFKGNSTLALTYRMGFAKLPFRLDFDELEAMHPEIKDQRFFGWKALSLANNARDPSLVRDKVAGDLYRAAGVPTPRSAFFQLFVDFGQGSTYFGLYTVTEVPDDPMLDTQFEANGGNLYKCDGTGARFVRFDAMAFEKKTNESSSTFADVMAVFTALHASRTDANRWRTDLDKVFNTSGFLRWLAVTTVLPNWDTYGSLPHNFYLYGVPTEGGRLHWIQWDNNESLKARVGIPLDLRNVSAQWPLVSYLGADPVYRQIYFMHMRAFLDGPFAAEKVRAQLKAEHALITPFVTGPEGEKAPYTLQRPTEFQSALPSLETFVGTRQTAARRVLPAQ